MERLVWELGTRFAGRGRCRDNKIKANVWIFSQDERSGPCREVAVIKGLTVHHLQCFDTFSYFTFKKINTESLAIIKYQVISPSSTVLFEFLLLVTSTIHPYIIQTFKSVAFITFH